MSIWIVILGDFLVAAFAPRSILLGLGGNLQLAFVRQTSLTADGRIPRRPDAAKRPSGRAIGVLTSQASRQSHTSSGACRHPRDDLHASHAFTQLQISKSPCPGLLSEQPTWGDESKDLIRAEECI